LSEEGENVEGMASQGAAPTTRIEGPTKTPPVTEGQEIDLEVIAKGRKGDGIAKIEGYIIFVPNGSVGQKVKVRVNTVRPNFAISEMIETAKEESEMAETKEES
jgi:predicted RNA-binding protein with TRAM domain